MFGIMYASNLCIIYLFANNFFQNYKKVNPIAGQGKHDTIL